MLKTIYCRAFALCPVIAKFGTCTVVGVNGTLVEAKMRTFTVEPTHLIFTYTHDGASSPFSTSRDETDYSVYVTRFRYSEHTYLLKT